MDMVIVWALSWWYGPGWKARVLGMRERLAASYDYFSINLLAKTLFAPFRQISAGSVNGPIGVKLRAFVDQLISRLIGAVVRTIFILVGSVWLLLQVILGSIFVILWAFVPLLPFIGFVATLAGWVPSWT